MGHAPSSLTAPLSHILRSCIAYLLYRRRKEEENSIIPLLKDEGDLPNAPKLYASDAEEVCNL